MKQEMMGWQLHQLDHMRIICTSLQTANHASTSDTQFLLTGRTLFLQPNQQCQSTDGKYFFFVINCPAAPSACHCTTLWYIWHLYDSVANNPVFLRRCVVCHKVLSMPGYVLSAGIREMRMASLLVECCLAHYTDHRVAKTFLSLFGRLT